jgi:hypothetical protein
MVDITLVDCLNGNPVIGCLDAQSISRWNVFKPTYYNYTFGFDNYFFEDNGCIVFIQGKDAKSMWQVRAYVEGSYGFELKKIYYYINSIPLHT